MSRISRNLIGNSLHSQDIRSTDSLLLENFDNIHNSVSAIGRKSTTETYPNITQAIEKIIDGNTYGDPSKELHWVASALSLRKISDILEADYSITVSHVKISQFLTDLGYSKQVNQKMEQVGIPSPDRNEQFEFIDHTAHEYLENGEPVISVDTKKTLAISKMLVQSTGK